MRNRDLRVGVGFGVWGGNKIGVGIQFGLGLGLGIWGGNEIGLEIQVRVQVGVPGSKSGWKPDLATLEREAVKVHH